MTISKFCLALIACPVLALLLVAESPAQVLSPDAVATSPVDSGVVGTDKTAQAAESDGFWSAIKMPKVTMPKISMPKVSFPSWPKDENGIAKSPFQPITAGMKSGVSKISSGTKKAWEGTKELFTFGGDEKASAAASSQQPSERVSVWDRIRGKEPEPAGPQTVAEWMSQPRINP